VFKFLNRSNLFSFFQSRTKNPLLVIFMAFRCDL